MEQSNDLNQLIDRYNFAISERDGARRAAEIYRKENEQLMQQFEQLQSASQLQSDVYRKLELRHREQTKELDRVLEQSMRELKASDEAWKKERRENEQLQKQLEKTTNERNAFRDYLAITVQALSVVEETLGKQNIIGDARLWSVYTKICEALSKTKNDPMNKEVASCLHGMNCSKHHPATDERYGNA